MLEGIWASKRKPKLCFITEQRYWDYTDNHTTTLKEKLDGSNFVKNGWLKIAPGELVKW